MENSDIAGSISIVIPTFWISIGILLFTAIQAAVLGFTWNRKALYWSFTLMCACAIGFQFGMVSYYTADSLPEAATALRLQFGFALAFFPAYFVFIALYSNQPNFKFWFILVALISAVLMVYHFNSPYGLRYETLELSAPLNLPWGETLSRFSGKIGLGGMLLRGFFVVITCWALWRAVVEYRQANQRTALFLMACLGLLIGSTIWGVGIDYGVIDSIYVIGFAYLGIALFMTISLGLELRDHIAWRERVVKELEENNLELEQIIYTISHDFRNPLVTLKMFLGSLESDLRSGDDEKTKKDLQYLISAADKLGILFDDVLDYSRAGKTAYEPEVVSLNQITEEVVVVLKKQIDETGAQITIAPDMPDVYVDRKRLREVLHNLLENAIKFSREGSAPRISVTAERQDDEVICRIKDNGIGIDPRFHEKVFGLFDRLETNLPGSGLGLALVKRILEIDSGRIWIESNENESGAVFCFVLRSPGSSPMGPESAKASVSGT